MNFQQIGYINQHQDKDKGLLLIILIIICVLCIYNIVKKSKLNEQFSRIFQKQQGGQHKVFQNKSIIQQESIKQVVLIGFGAVQKALMTLICTQENWLIKKYPILIIEPLDIAQSEIYQEMKIMNERINWLQKQLTEENYEQIFKQHIKNALVIDLAYRINTAMILKQCQEYNCFYINTAIDKWQFTLTPLYDTKQEILSLNRNHKKTAILNFGANPGLISIFVKYSLEQIALQSENKQLIEFVNNGNYSDLANELGLTMIQISERDTQQSNMITNEKQFINTWSVVGFLDEAYDYAQISLGTHETRLPKYTNIQYLETSGQVVLPALGHELKTFSYEPVGGKLIGFNIPHAECYSLVEFLRKENIYRPSIHYSYLPSDDCKLITHYRDYTINNKTLLPEQNIVLRGDQITKGYDSLGALMYFRDQNNYMKKTESNINQTKYIKTLWTGTIVQNNQVKSLGPFGIQNNEINATTVQVAIGCLSAILWMLEPQNELLGILEPEQLPAKQIINYCKPYLGDFLLNFDCTQQYRANSDQYFDLIVNPTCFKHIF